MWTLRRHLLRFAIATLVIVIAVGCASSVKLDSPKVSLISVSMMSADFFNQQFKVRLHVENPNTIALPIKKIEYKIMLEGDSFAEGESTAAFVVPASGSNEFDLIVNAHFASSLGRLLSRTYGENRNSVHYDVVGTVDVDKAFVPTLAFRESGMVELFKKK
jgi:LEA14-like dessication related protein